MAWRSLFVTTLLIALAPWARAVEFPYVAYVNSEDVYVRSGPGRNYYPTDKLQKGDKVEVYRHDPGGWYAIRPPEESFSWVSSRHVDVVDDRLAVVKGERVVARVGSAFSDVRDVIQVRLEKGEKLGLVEPPAGDSPWCKVAPPAGEFRWIFAKFVDSDNDVAQDDAEPEDASSTAGQASSGTPGARSGEVQLTSGTDAQPGDARVGGDKVKIAETQRRDLSTEAARASEINRLELEVSAMVVDEVAKWSFGELRRRADAVLAETQTATERGRARELVDKLARFEDIKQRSDAMRHNTDAADGAVDGAVARGTVDPRFDSVGRLAPVVSQRPNAPQFALVDASNAVVSFLTPAPGVNLRPYVDKYIGVNGQRGYMTDLGRQHINVQRVTLVDGVLRR
jgi:hypothetical protein